MKIPFDKDYFGSSLTPCPFDPSLQNQVGDYECALECAFCRARRPDYVICSHPEGGDLNEITDKLRKRIVTVLSRDFETMHVIEKTYYGLTKSEALKRFKKDHPRALRAPEHCKAFWWFEFEEISDLRNNRDYYYRFQEQITAKARRFHQ